MSKPPPRSGGVGKPAKVEFWSGKILYPVIVILLVLSGFFALAILPRLLESKNPLVARPAPEFALTYLPTVPAPDDAAKIDLAALKGKVVVLDFWAPWCEPCREEMPVIDSVFKKLGRDDVRFYGVMISGNADAAARFLGDNGIGYPQLDDRRGLAARAYDVQTIPTIVLVDRQGVIRFLGAGALSADDLESRIRSLM